MLGPAQSGGQNAGFPAEIDNYILAVFGGPQTHGEDLLDAQGIPFRASAQSGSGAAAGAGWSSGSPNGIADGIILVLTAGEDYAQ